jgi:nucleotide-binding universal stress UspA family protein
MLVWKNGARRRSLLASRFRETVADIAQEVAYGHSAAAIMQFAEANEVDLIALASHAVNAIRPGRACGTLS